MKIGILVSNIGNFGAKGLYNSQEIGMAKELNRNGHTVSIYKLISDKQLKQMEIEIIRDGVSITYIPVKHIGTHGLCNLDELDKNLDKLIHFSDIQLIFPRVFKWCKENSVDLLPYIGVIESNSDSLKVKLITNITRRRNLKLYKRCSVLAKTPYVKEKLIQYGVVNIDILPVGLDRELLKNDYEKFDKNELRKKYNLNADDKVLLFIGRLEEEKRPIEAINILKSINDKKFKMIIVGKGKLKDNLINAINYNKLNDKIHYIEKINNSDIWQLYYISDYFINLNKNEIFGMAILESLYYKCCVIASSAPGPNYIINDSIDGYLVEDKEAIIKLLQKNSDEYLVRNKGYEKIDISFSWKQLNELLN